MRMKKNRKHRSQEGEEMGEGLKRDTQTKKEKIDVFGHARQPMGSISHTEPDYNVEDGYEKV